MKKLLSAALALMMLLAAAGAAADALPTIDEVLASDLPDGRVEVSDDLSAYAPNDFGDIDYGNLRIIILTREAPKKEFTRLDSGYPLNTVDGFPDDFEGVDVGLPRVWLRCDLMRRLPEDFRAPSLAEADLLLIAESEYIWDGTLSNTTYAEGGAEDEIPLFDTTEEMVEYILAHQPVIESITYYPKFGSLCMLNLYSTVTKTPSVFGYTYVSAMRFARNPEASDHWANMETLLEIMTALEGESPDAGSASALLEETDFVPDSKKALWKSCIDAEEYTTAVYSIGETFWAMAEELAQLDPSEENRGNYRMVIDSRNAGGLAMLANYCNYSGFDRSIDSIEETGDYLADPDSGWMEDALEEFLTVFNEE